MGNLAVVLLLHVNSFISSEYTQHLIARNDKDARKVLALRNVPPLFRKHLIPDTDWVSKSCKKTLITGVGFNKVVNALSRIICQDARKLVLVPLHLILTVNLMDPDNVGTT